ncbi:hypothetical protein ACFSJQ_20405 [Vibrio olivae]|uniref:Prenylated flavin chaperone LpdD-like domain-containing protein n=1 Tax=Vibrio olivae TaxID=1243002 RepID=A0ABV5HMD8_9VIBR
MEFSAQVGTHHIKLIAVWHGSDMNISLFGGDVPHIGAVALAQNRPSLSDSNKVSASTSVMTVCGHKEDQVAKQVAETVAVKLNALTCVACGIHFNHIEANLFQAVQNAVDELVQQLFSAIDAQKD